jgi:hypothetical protein
MLEKDEEDKEMIGFWLGGLQHSLSWLLVFSPSTGTMPLKKYRGWHPLVFVVADPSDHLNNTSFYKLQ